MRAAAFQRAAAAAGPNSAAVAALRALVDAALDGATRAAARLLLRELAAALGVEPHWQEAGEAAAVEGLTRTRRRRAQRRAAFARLFSSGAAAGGGLDARCEGDSRGKMATVAKQLPGYSLKAP